MAKKKVKKSLKKKPSKKTKPKLKKRVKKIVTKSGPKRKPIGKVTHFYDKIKVAVIKFSKPVKLGASICFEGNKTCFPQVLSSMQYEHESIKSTKKGQEVGVKVKKEVREGDFVFSD